MPMNLPSRPERSDEDLQFHPRSDLSYEGRNVAEPLSAGSFAALFSLISCGMSLVPNSLQPGLPVNGSLWKTIGLILLLLSLISALAGVMTAMFEQVERRSEERMRRELQEGLARLSRNNRRK